MQRNTPRKFLVIDPRAFVGKQVYGYQPEHSDPKDYYIDKDKDIVFDGKSYAPRLCLKNGVEMIECLNELSRHGYEIVFCSNLHSYQQKEILSNLIDGCKQYKINYKEKYSRDDDNITFPDVKGIVAREFPSKETTVSFSSSVLREKFEIPKYSYEEKNIYDTTLTNARNALPNYVKQPENKSGSIFIGISDDAKQAAKKEGYAAFSLSPAHGNSLYSILKTIRTFERDRDYLPAQTITVEEKSDIGTKVTLTPSNTGMFSEQKQANSSDLKRVGETDLELYKKMALLINTLHSEINSSWPYPNKDRKKDKVTFLRRIMNRYEVFEGAVPSLKHCVEAELYRDPTLYQTAKLGWFGARWSNRTHDLLEEILKQPNFITEKSTEEKNERSPLLLTLTKRG